MKKEEILSKINLVVESSKEINPSAISDEVLSWLIKNVENFIDNHNKLFKLDLVIDENTSETMQETKKLQDLYRSIPDETKIDSWNDILKVSKEDTDYIIDESIKCREELDKITLQAFESMKKNEEKLNVLYEKMSFFYELKGVNRGRLLIQQLSGSTDIIRFEYEPFEVPVKIYQKNIKENANGESEFTQEESKTLIREYVVPDGFTVWVEISFKPLEQTTSLF